MKKKRRQAQDDNASWMAFGISAIVGSIVMVAITILVVEKPWKDKPTFTYANGEGGAPDAAVVAQADAGSDGGELASNEPPPSTSPTSQPLNVILITIDTLRYDLGFTGYERPVTPSLDALAGDSVVFERVYATASYTMKALSALFTGRYASEAIRDFNHYTLFSQDNVFLAERLQLGGVHTIGVHCHRYFAMRAGMEQGFDSWDLSAVLPNMSDSDTRPTSDRMTEAAIKSLTFAGADNKKFFAWLHYFDPHSPYVNHQGAPAFDKMTPTSENRVRDTYDAEVWFTDQQIGKFLDWVKAQPWAPQTAIIITGDHGEAFGEKGFFRHNKELWEPVVRVPLIVFVPGATPHHVTIKRSHIDLAPTILELMGLREQPPTLRGKSLMPDVRSLEGAPLEERDVLLDMPEGQMNELRRALITGTTPGMKRILRNKKYELYDLADDGGETVDLSTEPAQFVPIRTKFEALFGQLEEHKPTGAGGAK